MNIAFIIILVIFGVALLFLEIFFLPGITIAAVAGISCLVAAIIVAFINYGTVAGWTTLLISIALLAIFIIIFIKGKFWKKVSLNATISSKVEYKNLSINVGEKGVCVSRLAPMGNVDFSGNIIEVKSLSGFIDVGKEVEAVVINENEVLVKPV
ncbi:MAG: nodulation efficiency protein D (NfeD) [Prevotellaceae bacterium]|jgi:membrane-bound ClpP family serine protease|nr:nodulation efficiency protein D (NfeD) [Prevotellaceae bacterium]